MDFKVELFTFGCAKSQNLARLHEIAKISTRKIIPLPKSQNFVLANNSNNKVHVLVVSRSINMLSVTDFDPKGNISGVRVQAGLYLDMLDADRSPNAVSVHAGTSQVNFEVDCPPPAACPPGDLLITMVKETVILYKKEFRKREKSRISH